MRLSVYRVICSSYKNVYICRVRQPSEQLRNISKLTRTKGTKIDLYIQEFSNETFKSNW